MYINTIRKRSGLGDTFTRLETREEQMAMEIEEAIRRQEELAQKELLARTKMLTDKYGPIHDRGAGGRRGGSKVISVPGCQCYRNENVSPWNSGGGSSSRQN
jgi:hypothetical protein